MTGYVAALAPSWWQADPGPAGPLSIDRARISAFHCPFGEPWSPAAFTTRIEALEQEMLAFSYQTNLARTDPIQQNVYNPKQFLNSIKKSYYNIV